MMYIHHPIAWTHPPENMNYRCIALSKITIDHTRNGKVMVRGWIKDVEEGYGDPDSVYLRNMTSPEKDAMCRDVVNCVLKLGQGKDCDGVGSPLGMVPMLATP